MPAWLIPALKAILPHVGTIVTAAAPVFTRKKVAPGANEESILQQQIAELQSAVSANDAHIKDLAVQIKTTVEALEAAALLSESRYKRSLALCFAAIILSTLALGFALA